MDDAAEMHRAEALQRRLESLTKKPPHKMYDMLSGYRQWLDSKGIVSETDGWPNTNAYDEDNIRAFVSDWSGIV